MSSIDLILPSVHFPLSSAINKLQHQKKLLETTRIESGVVEWKARNLPLRNVHNRLQVWFLQSNAFFYCLSCQEISVSLTTTEEGKSKESSFENEKVNSTKKVSFFHRQGPTLAHFRTTHSFYFIPKMNNFFSAIGLYQCQVV